MTPRLARAASIRIARVAHVAASGGLVRSAAERDSCDPGDLGPAMESLKRRGGLKEPGEIVVRVQVATEAVARHEGRHAEHARDARALAPLLAEASEAEVALAGLEADLEA